MKQYDFLQHKQILFETSEKYNDIYEFFSNKYDIKYQHLFVLAATIGFKNNLMLEKVKRGREFRSSYLDMDAKSTIYTILFSDPDYGNNLELFVDDEKRSQLKKRIEEYAEGGMTLIVENIFKNKYKDGNIDFGYKRYAIDLIDFIQEETSKELF